MTQLMELGTSLNYNLEPARPRLTSPAYHRVVLISSHPLFLVGLRTELGQQADFRVVAEVANATEAVEVATTGPVGLIIIDQVRPGEAELTLKTLARRLQGRTPLVVLGSNETEAEIAQLRQLGATGYASKIQDGPSLCQVFQQAVAGRRVLPGIRAVMTGDNWPTRPSRPALPAAKPMTAVRSPLSPREMEILQVIAQGCSNKEVAQLLCISNHTLKNHLNNIFKKLEVEDRTQALMLSVRNGWIRL